MAAKQTGPPQAALNRFKESFIKSYGPDSIQTFGPDFHYDVIPTGSVALDYAMGCGGFVRGRLVELWGPEGMGKSTQLMIAAAEAQKLDSDKIVGWIDVEHTYDPNWAELHGMDLARTIVVQPDSAEEVADIAKDMCRSGLFNFIVLDSVGAMISTIEKEKDAGEATMGLVAKIVTRMVRLLAREAKVHNVVIAVINQVRASLAKYGPDTTRGGGFALGHVTTHRLYFKKNGESYTEGTRSKTVDTVVQVGQQIAVKIEKNKVAPPGRTAWIDYFNQPTEKYGPIGIDKARDAFDTGNKVEVYGRRGSWFDLPDGSKHNGADAALKYVRANPSAVDSIRAAVLATVAGELVAEPLQEG